MPKRRVVSRKKSVVMAKKKAIGRGSPSPPVRKARAARPLALAPTTATAARLKTEPDPSATSPVFANLSLAVEQPHGGKRKAELFPLKFPPGGWKAVENAAMEWTYVLRSRSRWASSNSAADQHIDRATEQLLSFGIPPSELQQLARAGHVEVQMAASATDDGGWSARILPWEYVIAGATRPFRHGEPLTVTRALDVTRPAPLPDDERAFPPARLGDLRILYVESAPGEIGKQYDFHGERELIDIYLMDGLRPAQLKRLYSPTLNELAGAVREHRPHIVHLAGVDSHEADILLHWQTQDARAGGTSVSRGPMRGEDETTSQFDGYVLIDAYGKPLRVRPESLADALTGMARMHSRTSEMPTVPAAGAPGRWYPWLVCMNIENSAARLAPRAVQWGAHAAIGFQDAFDSALAELFYGTLYAALRRQWNLADAFQQAWRAAREHPVSSIGTGVVLWTDTPTAEDRPRKQRNQVKVPWTKPDEVDLEWIRQRVRVSVVPMESINYSLLHNNGELFDTFSLKPGPDTAMRSVEVRAMLSAGLETAEFTCAVDLNGQPVDLRSRIRVSLGANLIRSVHEAISTTWCVEITWGPHVLLRQTYPVRLLPIDQWRDAESGRSWLPSFVFPRDPAVGDLVTRAANYVRVLRDDPSAGFEGYQAVPENPTPRDASDVDLQVQAIWSAILYEWRLTYINPPPSYSAELDSQRLRTPSMIAHDRNGTCIDLALLMAACLELVDVWPVIFLFNDHAFPGYWRASEFHGRFRSASPEEGAMGEIVDAGVDANSAGGAQRYPWAVGRAMTREILREIRAGRLVPLETVRLTENCGFDEAIQAAKENFDDPNRFEFLIDIAIAREHGITPLPLVGEVA